MANALVALVLAVLGLLIGGFIGVVFFVVALVFAALALRDLIS